MCLFYPLTCLSADWLHKGRIEQTLADMAVCISQLSLLGEILMAEPLKWRVAKYIIVQLFLGLH